MSKTHGENFYCFADSVNQYGDKHDGSPAGDIELVRDEQPQQAVGNGDAHGVFDDTAEIPCENIGGDLRNGEQGYGKYDAHGLEDGYYGESDKG